MRLEYPTFNACGLPRHFICPLTMIVIRVHNASHSSILCMKKQTKNMSQGMKAFLPGFLQEEIYNKKQAVTICFRCIFLSIKC